MNSTLSAIKPCRAGILARIQSQNGWIPHRFGYYPDFRTASKIAVLYCDHKLDRRGHRCINGQIGLQVPVDVVKRKCRRYRRGSKTIHRAELLHDTPYSIVMQFQQEYRGLVEYYQMAYNLYRLNRLKWIMEQSLALTLAYKLRVSARQVYHRYQATLQTEQGPRVGLRVGLQVKVERGKEKKPLVATWGGISLARQKKAVLNDQPLQTWGARSELEKRLLADKCELCGSRENIQVHHIRALKDLQKQGRTERPAWVRVMAARRRKTLVVCRSCHTDIHAGRTQPCRTDTTLDRTRIALESRVLRKA